MIRTYRTESIILARRNIDEADKLLTIFTRFHGKKLVVAHGIRKTTSKRGPYLELFSHIELHLYPGKTFDVVAQVASIYPFMHLRRSLERVGFAYIALELTSRLTAENQEAHEIFVELVRFLHVLDDSKTKRHEAQKALINYKQFLLTYLGFIPQMAYVTDDALDQKIESVIESTLKSPRLLTNIQAHL